MPSLILPYPPHGVNHSHAAIVNRKTGKRGRALVPEMTYWQHETRLLLHQALVIEGVEPLVGDVEVDLVIVHKPDRSDVDSRVKAILDVCQGFIYENDRQIRKYMVEDLIADVQFVRISWKPYCRDMLIYDTIMAEAGYKQGA